MEDNLAESRKSRERWWQWMGGVGGGGAYCIAWQETHGSQCSLVWASWGHYWQPLRALEYAGLLQRGLLQRPCMTSGMWTGRATGFLCDSIAVHFPEPHTHPMGHTLDRGKAILFTCTKIGKLFGFSRSIVIKATEQTTSPLPPPPWSKLLSSFFSIHSLYSHSTKIGFKWQRWTPTITTWTFNSYFKIVFQRLVYL